VILHDAADALSVADRRHARAGCVSATDRRHLSRQPARGAKVAQWMRRPHRARVCGTSDFDIGWGS
jgi:hypothetical protein